MTHVVLVLLGLWTTIVGGAQCLISCDFEDGLCGWSDLSNSSYDWTRHSGPTADFTSGPDNDHTFKDGTGHYVYTSGQRAARSSVAQLRSSTVILTSSVNLTFWYHMNGNGIGNVSLIREDNDTDDGIVLWSRHGRQGFNWLESHITLDPGTFQLQFESTVSHPYGSDMALDDIRLWSEPHVARTRSPPTSTTETTQMSTPGMSTTTVLNCNVQGPAGLLMSGSCDFETNGTCGYTSSRGPLQWGLTHGKKGYLYVIPGDHGTGTGNYMYLATDNISSRAEDMARLTSPALGLNTYVCLQFAYIITSGDPNTLTVYAETSGQRRPIASVTTHGMTSWRVRENITLCADASTKIVFEGTKKSHASFIGLDDINVTSGACEFISGNSSSSHTTSHQSSIVTSTTSSASTWSSSTSIAHTTIAPTEGGQTLVPQSSSVSSSVASTRGQISVLLSPSSSPSSQAPPTQLTGHSFPYTEETSRETTQASSVQQSEMSSSPTKYSASLGANVSVSDSSSPATSSTEGNSATTEETVMAEIRTTSCQDNVTTIPEVTSTVSELSTASENSSNNKGSSAQTSPSITSRTPLPRTTTPFTKKREQSSQGGLSYDDKVVVIIVACGAFVIAVVIITVWRLHARRKLHLSDIPSTLDTNIELQAKVYTHNTHL
ncbi:uncharacterized protein [Haliotis asinina]|uniref:uncharacterized protein n=1 Tax=Haliotis asinina TaxID=109174 RepID=UPI0035323D8D